MLVRALGLESRKLPTSHLGWQRILGGWGGLPTESGVVVSEASALSISTVFACVRVYSFLVASLPLVLYQRTGEQSRRRAVEKPLYRVLHSLANPRTTAFQARAFATSQILLRGNGLAFAEKDSRGETLGLWPLRWDQVTPRREARRIVYDYHPTQSDSERFDESEVWHPIGLSQDGVLGLSPVAACREAFGAAIAARDYAATFWKNGGTPAGVLTHPETLGKGQDERDAAVARLRSGWDELYTGTEHAHRVAVLEEGMKFEAISLNPAETQVLESRKFSRGELAAIFGIPPHIIGDLERATFGNIEQQSLELVIYHLTPFLTALEQTLERDLLSEEQRRQGYYIKHTVDGLLRGDSNSRANYFRTAIMTGWLNANEVRALEDRDAVPGLDTYLVPLNMGQAPGDGLTPGAPILPLERPGGGRSLLAEPDPAARVRAQVRAKRASGRPELAAAFRPVLEDAFGRLLRAEVRELKKKLALHLERSEDSMQIDLEAFYAEGSEFSLLASKTLTPGISALARASFERAGAETPQPPSREKLDEFLAALVGAAIGRSTIASRIALVSALQAQSEGPPARERVEALFALWLSERAGRASARESVQISRAAAVEAFARGGALMKRWVTRGADCVFCAALDGQEVELRAPFVEAGQVLVVGDQTMVPRSRIGHAPLHRGCDCDVVPA